MIADWRQAEAAAAAYLARVAGRLGALDDRLRRGPDGWRHRLALLEAADLSWVLGDRITPDRLALWTALRLSGVQDDTAALARAAWAARRLTGGPGPEAGLAEFLGRHDPEHLAGEADRFADRSDSWLGVMAAARPLPSVARACMGYHLWALAGLGHQGGRRRAGGGLRTAGHGRGRGSAHRRAAHRPATRLAGRDGARDPGRHAASGQH